MAPETVAQGPRGASDENPRSRPRNIVLIGYRGCGKTSVGRELAERLGWRFVDTDAEIAHAAGRTIREIFATDGEARFRELEQAAIVRVTTGQQQVISVGGGAVTRAGNRSVLRGCGLCIWLTAPAEELHARMLADPRNAETRPALTAAGGLAEIQALLAQRRPMYAATAHREVSTSGRSRTEVVADILILAGLPGGPANEE